MDKKKIRAEVRALKKMLDKSDITKLSNHITERFLALDEYRNAENIYVYFSNNQEVRTNEIIARALSDGKHVAIPKVYGGDTMEFITIKSLSDEMEAGLEGILVPVSNDAARDSAALIVMPGLAFDYELNRIGYGGGFYDRYLNKYSVDHNFTKVALCYDFQIYSKLPVEEHDEKVDMVVTPTLSLQRQTRSG